MIWLWKLVEHAYKKLITRYAPDTSLKSCHRSMWQSSFSSTYKPHTVSALRPLVLTWEFEVTQLTTVTLLCEWERAGTSFETFWVEMKTKIYMNQLSWVSTFCLPTGFGLWKTSRVNAEHFFGGQLSDLGSYPQVPHCTNLKAFTCTFQASAS